MTLVVTLSKSATVPTILLSQQPQNTELRITHEEEL